MPEAPGTEHLPPSPCTQNPAGPTRSLGGRQNAQQRGAAGLGRLHCPYRLDSVGGGTTLKQHREPLASKTAKSKNVECKLPLTGVPQGHHKWWTKGLGGSRRTLRKWIRVWTTAKSVAQEGRKVKPFFPPTPFHFTDSKTRRTDLTSLKPAEDIFIKFLLPFSPSFFFIPSSFLPSFTFLFILPAFLPFHFHSFYLLSHLLFYFSNSFSHRGDTWSSEKTRVRPCWTHKRQPKTSDIRRLRRRHH